MSSFAASAAFSLARVRDVVELGKPRLSLLVIFTAAVGIFLAPQPPALGAAAAFLVATSCLVAAANTLNCWIEREIDALMHRTRRRPLPDGRLEPRVALVSGSLLGAASLAVIQLSTNTLTMLLGAAALASYVLVYTPAKRFTPWALPIGAIPGALPPLMGWTAATETLSAPGLFLFAVLFAWQLPHFAAISLYLKEDFARGGIRVLSIASGERTTRRWILLFSAALVAVSFVAMPLGLAGWIYTAAAAVLGLPFLYLGIRGLRADPADGWARTVFGYSLLYLPLLITTLVLDAA